MSAGPGMLPDTTGRTVTIALPAGLPALPFAPTDDRGRGLVRIRTGAVLIALGAVAFLALTAGVKIAAFTVVGVVALAVVVAAIFLPGVALTILVVTEMTNFSPVLVTDGVPGIATPLLVLGLISVLVATRTRENRALLRTMPVAPALLIACYILAVIPSAILTTGRTETGNKMFELVRDWVFLLVVLALARLQGRPWRLAALIVLPLVAIAVLTVINQLVLQQTHAFFGFATISKASGELTTTPRHSGPMEDSNFWGRVLVLGIPLAIALGHRAAVGRRALATTGWVVSLLLLLAAVYLTQSRGTLLSAFVAVPVWIVAAGPKVRRQALVLLPVLVALMLLPGIGNRLVNVSEAFDDAPDYAKDPSIVERAAAGDIARQIFSEHPIFGTGPATFALQLNDYAARKPDRLIGITTAAHNLYLEILSETGVLGLAGWIVLIGGVMVLAVRAIVRLAGVPPDAADHGPTRGLAAGALAAVVAWSAASIFLHLAVVRTLWLVLALIGILHVLSRERAAQAGPVERHATRLAQAGLARGLVVATVMAVAGGSVGGAILYNLSTHRYTARAAQTLLPTPEVYQAYSLNVRRRTPVLPAYAAMLQGAQSRAVLKIDGEPKTGIITFVSVGDSQQEAMRRVASAIAAAPATLRRYGANRQYTLVDVSPVDVTSERVYPPLAIVLTGLAVGAELAFCLLMLRLWRRR